MSTVSAAPARSAGYRRGASSSSISAENLPPRTLARAGREVRDLIKNPPEGIKLVVDNDTGMPSNLGEIVVRGYSVLDCLMLSLLVCQRRQTAIVSCLKLLLSKNSPKRSVAPQASSVPWFMEGKPDRRNRNGIILDELITYQ